MYKERSELHAHTNMSAMDGVDSVAKMLFRAAELGLHAIAVTDLNTVQAFPEAEEAEERLAAQGNDIRVLYGMDTSCTNGGSAFQITVLARTREGLKNLYRLVTLSHTKNIGKEEPQISKDELAAHRKGLLLGSGGFDGELMQAVASRQPWSRLLEIAGFYDYLEIQPFLDHEANQTVVRLGEALNIPVCAAGNVYFCSQEDEILRHILHDACEKADVDEPMPFYLRTTEEMLAEFAYLGAETAYEVVVENPNRIADRIEPLRPIPEGVFPPKIHNAEERLSALARKNAKEQYGEPLPKTVQMRLEKELSQIVEHGYAAIYLTAQMLAEDSRRQGYHTVSRGSVGASLVTHLVRITEVNPLPPHYVCMHCRYTEFLTDGEAGSGFDLPKKACPQCGGDLRRDGQDIPIEVFAGLDGEKVPDIDLNIAPAYMPAAYEFLKSQFGKEHILKPGTVSTVSVQLASRYVRRYAERHSLQWDEVEILRLSERLKGVKCGFKSNYSGWIVIPADSDIEDFTPAQITENDPESACPAAHFDFYRLHGLFKQDILGYTVPAAYRALEEMTGIPVTDVPMSDLEVYSLFTSPKALGVTAEEIDCETGTLGLTQPETEFARKILTETKPKNCSHLMKVLGLCHGSGVWEGNAQELLAEGTCSLSDVIALRDDVMQYLMRKGFPADKAYEIMEQVRKGQGRQLSPEVWEEFLAVGVPKWYLVSCEKILYLFPKAHVAEYMMSAVRLGWYKIHYPAAFYAACLAARYNYLKSKGEALDISVLLKGPKEIRRCFIDWKERSDEDPTEERKLFYHLAYEAAKRGISFLPDESGKFPSSGFYADNGTILISV